MNTVFHMVLQLMNKTYIHQATEKVCLEQEAHWHMLKMSQARAKISQISEYTFCDPLDNLL